MKKTKPEKTLREFRKLKRDCWDKDCAGCKRDDKRILQFIKRQKKELVGRLRMEKWEKKHKFDKSFKNRQKELGRLIAIGIASQAIGGYNQAVSELNKRLDEELK